MTCIGGTVTDGTVVWLIGKPVGLVNDSTKTTYIIGGKSRNLNPCIQIIGGEQGGTNAGNTYINAANKNTTGNVPYLTIKSERALNWCPSGASIAEYDLGNSAIVAQSPGANGYIKYASGLILQWGGLVVSTSGTKINFPISFSTAYKIIGMGAASNGTEVRTWGKTQELSGATLLTNINAAVLWFAIGY